MRIWRSTHPQTGYPNLTLYSAWQGRELAR